ncbi:hypothetical protein CL614_05230 [archaeon]|nr:hypothetical protein [archaeon]|tara:strand:- start:3148 stop:3576 length:429 start_codon:yes stop_codon:yes gene_type:complete
MKILVTDDNEHKELIKELEQQGHEITVTNNLGSDHLRKTFENQPEICIHLLQAKDNKESKEKPLSFMEANVIGTINLLEQCKKHNTKLIMLGNPEKQKNPKTPYDASTASAELYAFSYANTYEFPIKFIENLNNIKTVLSTI